MLTRLWLILAAAAAGVALGSSPAEAACACWCVEGKVVLVCDAAEEAKTATRCGKFKYCKPAPPRPAPGSWRPRFQSDSAPLPKGTSSCEPSQVLNVDTRKYEWVELCEHENLLNTYVIRPPQRVSDIPAAERKR